jgi:arsenite methyltransferase
LESVLVNDMSQNEGPRTVFEFISPDYGSSIVEDGCCGSGCCDFDADITIAELDGITAAVQERYGNIAENAADRAVNPAFTRPTDKFYSAEQREALPVNAMGASAGCGNPVAKAEAQQGETVLDLGSGGGVDCFLAAHEVGSEGQVIGVDMTPKMHKLAQETGTDSHTDNVSFKLGNIEMLPQADTSVDLVISNSTISLSENKDKVFAEIKRILKPGGRFVISDVVTEMPLPENIQNSAAEWVSCVGGAAVKSEYLELIEKTGFTDIEVLDDDRTNPNDSGWRASLINLTLRAYKPA